MALFPNKNVHFSKEFICLAAWSSDTALRGKGCWIAIRTETSGEKQNLSFPLLKNKKINLFLTTIKSSVFLNHIFTVSQTVTDIKMLNIYNSKGVRWERLSLWGGKTAVYLHTPTPLSEHSKPHYIYLILCYYACHLGSPLHHWQDIGVSSRAIHSCRQTFSYI